MQVWQYPSILVCGILSVLSMLVVEFANFSGYDRGVAATLRSKKEHHLLYPVKFANSMASKQQYSLKPI